MANVSPAVSIVIPCRNEARHIEDCLRAVLAFESPPGGYEVIVADGMSDDGTRKIVAEMATSEPRLRLIDNPEKTTPHALNAGIRAACGEIIVRIDAHSEYAPDYLVQCVLVLQETGADDVGGPWVARGRSYVQRCIAAAFNTPFAVGGARAHQADYEGPIDNVYLGCWRRELLERIGSFDEEFVRNQDDELCFRLQRMGAVIWQSPRIRSWYTPRSSLSGLFRQYFQYGYWKIRVIQKHGAPASFRHIVPGFFVITLLVLAPIAFFSVPVALALALLLAAYVIPLGVASVHAAAGAGWELLPLFPLVFVCYHFGYGLGFLFGLWDFVVRRRTGRFVALTRG